MANILCITYQPGVGDPVRCLETNGGGRLETERLQRVGVINLIVWMSSFLP